MSIEDESTLTVSWDFTYSELGEVAKALRWLGWSSTQRRFLLEIIYSQSKTMLRITPIGESYLIRTTKPKFTIH